MEQLFEIFGIKLRSTPMKFKRFLYNLVAWDNRLISIQGARGAGKTTLILQHIHKTFETPSNKVLYADVNHVFFSRNTLIELADQFYKTGGQYLFLDEIHKYKGWPTEIKQIYDTYKDLHIVITGSSMLEIKKGEADLSRRIVSYLLPGLSFREYLLLEKNMEFDHISLDAILREHQTITYEINKQVRPLEFFSDYLQNGYYPYFIEGKEFYPQKLLQTIDLILEVDLPAVEPIVFSNIVKLKKLLSIISESTPFKPNTHKIAELTEVSRVSLLRFMNLLERAELISLLQSATKGIRKLGKPEKIYLNNPNLMHVLSPSNVNKGNLRETFFYNQLKHQHTISLPNKGDFLVDDRIVFEIGGKNKNASQIAAVKNAFLVKDDIETGAMNTIPLWLFGFLY
jgi:predicted AAA+ superfamily ATPase